MPRSWRLKRDITNYGKVGLDKGAIVYSCLRSDYGLSSDDTRILGYPCISVTLNEDGDYPGYSIAYHDLEVLSDNKENNMNALDKQEGGDHYKKFKIQPVEFCQVNKIPTCEANVIKYVCRHSYKNGREDIKKAIHYLELLLDLEYPESK